MSVEPRILRRSQFWSRPRRAAGALLRLVRFAGARQDALAEWRRRLGGEPALPAGPVERVIVLCHGNICRSPFVEHLLAERHPSLDVRSAGLAAGDGDPAEPFARKVAKRFDVTLEGHRSQRVTEKDLDDADLILVMQGSQANAVRALSTVAADRTRLLGDYLPDPPHLIMDPWGHEEDVFQETFNRAARAVERLGVLIDGASREEPAPRSRG